MLVTKVTLWWSWVGLSNWSDSQV